MIMVMTACSAANNEASEAADDAAAGIKKVTAITEVFGTGQQVTAVAVDYGTPIDGTKLFADDYSITDRTVAKIYTNTEPAKSDSSVNGNYVILELEALSVASAGGSEQNGEGTPPGGAPGQNGEGMPPEGALGQNGGEMPPGQNGEGMPQEGEPGQNGGEMPGGELGQNGRGMPPGGEPGQRPEGLPEENGEAGSEPFQPPESPESSDSADSAPQGGIGDGGGSPALGSEGDESELSNHLTATITQSKDIAAENGEVIEPTGEAIESTDTVNLVVDDFEQLVFTDPNHDDRELMYNLYVPENYDADKTYPLVLFMVDAGGVGTDPVKTLTQGLGAIIWATPEEQAKHECFVLAPQYTEVMANDNSETTVDMDVTVDLIYDLAEKYSIDMGKLYNTGQSMGCMTSIAMDIKYPDLFAASFLVAGQWDASLVAPLANKPLWIVVCDGDTKAKPGMDAIAATLIENGATVSTATWDSAASGEQFDAYVAEMLVEGCDVNYATFEGGSHTYTWQVAYTIEGVRDWLFQQTKP
jgi:predicted peptidase